MYKRAYVLGLLAATACSSSAANPSAATSAVDGGAPLADSSAPAPVTEGAGDAATGATFAMDATAATDAGDAADPSAPAPGFTVAHVPVPAGFTRVISDHFGTGSDETVTNYTQLHAKYYESSFFNRDANGLVKIPNVTINDEQETYVHFETAIVFSSDHLTIQARGQADGSITSGEMVSVHTARSFCVEGKYRTTSVDKAWPALWWYGATAGGDASEIDIEQPNTPYQGVHVVSMANHPYSYDTIDALDPKFSSSAMAWTDPTFDGSAAPHVYTMCYDDAAATLERWLDGGALYSASWKWNKSLGGTGNGPDATTIVNMAVGGDWPGNTSDPVHYSADFDLYSLDWYEPGAP